MAWRMPLDGKYAYGPKFGVVDSWHPNGHRGTDYNGFKEGTKLFAVNNGTIVVNKWSDGLGNVVVLKVGGKYFGYCHMVKPSPLKVGTVVKAGDVVGQAGTTGKFSSGTHLHLTLAVTPDGVFAGKVYDADAFLKQKIAEQKAVAKAKAKEAAKAAPAEAVAPEAPVAKKVAKNAE
jgi:murein DD-endopeptidase MepM/ murein hydrolase activator NlpD